MELTSKQIKQYKDKSIQQLLKIAEKNFNTFIRKRDSNGDRFTCISCRQTKHVSMMHAGHYMSAGHHSNVRFDERNVNGQCSACNCHLHGNLVRYRENLVIKIGVEEVEFLESISRLSHKWDRFRLIGIIETYKGK